MSDCVFVKVGGGRRQSYGGSGSYFCFCGCVVSSYDVSLSILACC